MNYIYLKTSTEPVKVGDLTEHGIVDSIGSKAIELLTKIQAKP